MKLERGARGDAPAETSARGDRIFYVDRDGSMNPPYQKVLRAPRGFEFSRVLN
jgi:hypothetical protein